MFYILGWLIKMSMSQYLSQRFHVLFGNLSNYNAPTIIGTMGAEKMEDTLNKGFGNINDKVMLEPHLLSHVIKAECDYSLGKIRSKF